MADFEDDFRRSDRDLHSDGGWTVLASTDNTTDVLGIRSGYVTNLTTNAPAVASQSGTPATTFAQEVGASLTATVEGADSYIDVGCGYKPTGANFAAHPRTISARFRWLPSGARKLQIVSRLRGGSEIVHKDLDLATAGGVVSDHVAGDLREGGALSAEQLVVMTVERIDSGLLARVFLNNPDIDRPIMSAVIGHGYPPPDASDETDPGFAYLMFGSNGTAQSLRVTYFAFADSVAKTIDVTGVDGDEGTMRRMIALVRQRLGRGISERQTNIDPEAMRQDLRDSVEQIMLELGDLPWFAVREESLTLTIDDLDRATLPISVRRIHAIYREDRYRSKIWWQYLFHDTQDRLVIRVDPSAKSGAVTVRYLVRHKQFWDDDDRCPIPREHQELVVVDAALRSAEREQRFTETRNTLLARKRELMMLCKREQQRHLNQTRDIYQPVRQVRGYRRLGRRGAWGI